MNIAGGTHHAFQDRGEGFCLLNDLAVTANYLIENKIANNVLIVDLDVHQGNGTAAIFHYLFETNWIIGAAIGLMTVITATCGDLIESAIKRDLAIKDMSNLLPGHGGIMDRLDSALFTAPAVWFAFELIARYL
jgi:CDP-diglyceride synthetase